MIRIIVQGEGPGRIDAGKIIYDKLAREHGVGVTVSTARLRPLMPDYSGPTPCLDVDRMDFASPQRLPQHAAAPTAGNL
jgi:hypothetical protein